MVAVFRANLRFGVTLVFVFNFKRRTKWIDGFMGTYSQLWASGGF